MKQLLLAFLIISSTMVGMTDLQQASQAAFEIYLFDRPADRPWDMVNQPVDGQTILDFILSLDRVDDGFITFLRNRGARRGIELGIPIPTSRYVSRIAHIVGHVTRAN